MGNISKIRIQNTDYAIKDSRVDDKVDKVTSTDNAVVRFDGTSGNIQNSGVTINDSNHLTAAKLITSGGTSSQFVKGDGSLDDGIYMTTNTFSGDSGKIYIPYIMNGLYTAHKRFTVTAVVTNADSTQTTWGSSYYSQLFDGSYETNSLRIPAGGSLKVTITNGDIDTTSITTYKAGYFLVSFFNTKVPASVTGRIYTGNPDGAKSWSNITFTRTRGTYDGTYISSELTGNYLRAIEITITSKSDTAAWVSEIEYWKERPASISDYPIITKFAGGEVYGNLTAPKFITKGGTSSQFVKGDGSLDSTTYAPLASPALAGTPTAPTAASGTNTTQIATTAFVQSAVPKDYQVDYSKTYLTFEAIESGTFTFTGYSTNTVSYSIDNGKTWTSLTSATASPTISAGDRIMWKASGLSIDSSESGIGTFSATGNFNIEGNAMSLASGDDFIGKTTISSYQFRTLFKNNTKLISAENLILPATTASIGCYREMFYGCTGLTTPPELPATTLSNNCYDAMFCGCTSLKTAPKLYATTLASYSYRQLFDGCTLINHIECLATDISASNCTQYITRDVASTGTFVIADGMTSWQRNYHGIPSGWTVRTKSEMEHVTKGELDDLVGNIETLLASI